MQISDSISIGFAVVMILVSRMFVIVLCHYNDIFFYHLLFLIPSN